MTSAQFRYNSLEHHADQGTSMITMVLVGISSLLALLAIILKARAAKPKETEKCERAQIVKQLLALSEREDIMNGVARKKSVSQRPTPRRRAAAGTSPSPTM